MVCEKLALVCVMTLLSRKSCNSYNSVFTRDQMLMIRGGIDTDPRATPSNQCGASAVSL
jgi:hypothetical protein